MSLSVDKNNPGLPWKSKHQRSTKRNSNLIPLLYAFKTVVYIIVFNVCRVNPAVLLTLKTTGWWRGKARIEWKRKMGLREGTVLVFLKHDNQIAKREPSRDHSLDIFIFFKFIFLKLR